MITIEFFGYIIVGMLIATAVKLILRGKLTTTTTWPATILMATITIPIAATIAHYGINFILQLIYNDSTINPTLADGRPGYRTLVFITATVISISFMLLVEIFLAKRKTPTTNTLLQLGETSKIEYKSTARINLHTNKSDQNIINAILKTIVGFLNSAGGTLLIGVDDTGKPLGLEPDMKTLRNANNDNYQLWLSDIIAATIGTKTLNNITITFPQISTIAEDTTTIDTTICQVDVRPSRIPYFLTIKDVEYLYVRYGNSTRSVPASQITSHVNRQRWSIQQKR